MSLSKITVATIYGIIRTIPEDRMLDALTEYVKSPELRIDLENWDAVLNAFAR
jgi:hypothetical protein